MAKKVIIASDYFNALYENGVLAMSGKPDHVDAETLSRVHPDAEVYTISQDVYHELLNGADYPASIEDVPLSRLQRIR